MTRAEANRLLEAARCGAPVPAAGIRQALQATGDVAPAWTPGTWWRAPPDQIFRAYYLNLRIHYEMPALEAIRYARDSFAKFPDFFARPIETLREAINPRKAD